MIRPPYLQNGDTIGITAPAGALSRSEIEPAVELIRAWGLKVILAPHLFNRRNSFAGTDRQRAADFQEMLDNRAVRAILCARGGYGTGRIINRLSFGSFLQHPKWIVGFSDITVLHAALQQCLGVESLHGVMPRVIPPAEPDLVSFDSLRAMLFGEVRRYSLAPHRLNIAGKGSGTLVGGNLSVLYSLSGTCYDPDTRGKVLFIEDLNEYSYHIDRMVVNFVMREKLAHLAGLIVGDMHGMKATSFRTPVYAVIRQAVKDYGYPVLFGFPAGHSHPNLTLPFGRQVKLAVTPSGCTLNF